MHNSFFKKFSCYLLLLSALFVQLNVAAQPVEETSPPDEEIYMEEDSITVESSPFDTVRYFYQYPVAARIIPDTKIRRLKSDPAYWYADYAPEKQKKDPKKSGQKNVNSTSTFQSIVFIIILIAFIGIVIWYLASIDIRLFRKKSAAVETTEEEELSKDIFSLEYDDEINKAVAAGNYRLAVRLMYLRTLTDLADKGLISYTHEKTNSDYLTELSGTPYYKSFFRLTRDFDYTWYGKFELTPETFAVVQKDFIQFKQYLAS